MRGFKTLGTKQRLKGSMRSEFTRQIGSCSESASKALKQRRSNNKFEVFCALLSSPPCKDSDQCEPCPKGTYSTQFSDQWPLGCTFCPSTSYQDQADNLHRKTNPVLMSSGVCICFCVFGWAGWADHLSSMSGQYLFRSASRVSGRLPLQKGVLFPGL